MIITRFSITQNKDMKKRMDRKALTYSQYSEQTYIGDGIVHLTFLVNGEKVVFLDDRLNAKWLVSECNKYIVGSGVLNKVYKSTK